MDDYRLLIDSISELDEVMSVGKSGGEKLPEYNESDIDIFVFCSRIPDIITREEAMNNSGASVST